MINAEDLPLDPYFQELSLRRLGANRCAYPGNVGFNTATGTMKRSPRFLRAGFLPAGRSDAPYAVDSVSCVVIFES
ncbi:MAG: hypothetical protein IIC54_00400 [Proteobacteria bacterium]|nr:hypothetical protein [Pseudomonadota bacterium]MCH7956049.1 hypothetical protein [Pseudomonadota bacterium]MCH8212509.1 hypothetical protein [Pseudomonadota bacterium]